MEHRKTLAKNIQNKWKKLNPKRRKAQQDLNNALRDGKIIALPCFVCGLKAEAHHPNYDAPLDVIWLCPPHHKQTHALAKLCL